MDHYTENEIEQLATEGSALDDINMLEDLSGFVSYGNNNIMGLEY